MIKYIKLNWWHKRQIRKLANKMKPALERLSDE